MVWSLPWERTQDTAHKIVSEFFSSHTSHNVPSMLRQCIQSSFQLQFVYITVFLSTGQWPNITYITKSVPVHIHYIQWYNVFNREEDRSMFRAMAQCYQSNTLYIKDNLPLLWYLENVNFWNESKESKESVKCFVKFFVPKPIPCIPWD